MNKKVIIALFIILVVIPFLLIFIKAPSKKMPPPPNQITTPTSIPVIPTSISVPSISPVPSTVPLSVVQTSLQGGNIPVSQTSMAITFNRPFSLNEFVFAIDHDLTYTIAIQDNILLITFKSEFQPATTYTYTFTFTNRPSQSYSFTTVSQAPTPKDSVPGVVDDYSRTHYPDVFLYNRTPYDSADFSVTGDLTDSPTQHDYFTVTLKGSDVLQSKQSFINWLHSLGLADQQIQTLDIRYQ